MTDLHTQNQKLMENLIPHKAAFAPITMGQQSGKPESYLQLHDRAVSRAEDIKQNYIELFRILLEVERREIYLQFDIIHLKTYCIELLNLSDSVAKDFVTVVRKSLEVPSLAKAVIEGRVTIAKARKVCPVITEEKSKQWIYLARDCTTRVIEKVVAGVKPEAFVTESMKYVASDVLEFKLGVSEEWEKLLIRTKDLMSQKERRNVFSEEALFKLMTDFCERNDPVKKAERAAKRPKKETQAERNERRIQLMKDQQAHDAEKLPTRQSTKDRQVHDAETLTAQPTGDQRVHNAAMSPAQKTKDHRARDQFVRTVRLDRTNKSELQKPITSKQSRYIPMSIEHEVNLRDGAQCTFIDRNGKRCEERRWLDLHHVREFALGGEHSANNLETLCSGHHKIVHLRRLN